MSHDVPELLPARMLNEYAYCPRLFYLEWVQQEWADNADTVEGTLRHKAVDRVTTRGHQEPTLAHTSLQLSAPLEGLIARLDLMEDHQGHAVPVDFKRGKTPKVEEGAWEPERLQLCAQGLILREHGYTVDYGELYFVASRRRVRIDFDDALIERTRHMAQEARRCAASGQIPPPLEDSPKCNRCSLVGICLPDEVHHLKAQADPAAQAPRRLVPSQRPRLPLYVQEQAARLGKRGELLTVTHQGKTLGTARTRDISHVVLCGQVAVTAQALRHLCGEGIPIAHFSYGGWFYGVTRGHDHKNIERRLRQFQVATDPARSLELARRFVWAKIRNTRVFLRRNHTLPSAQTLEDMKRLANRALVEEDLEVLRGLEGVAARLYFQSFAGMLKVKGFSFEGRNRRPPADPINALLSLGYGLLTGDFAVAAMMVGFDPYLGFFHTPRYGKPALALDIMEEFRAIIADSVVLTVVNNGTVVPEHFLCRGGAVLLNQEGRRLFLQAYEQRMQTTIKHPTLGYEVTYRQLLSLQLRLLDRHLMGELEAYPSYLVR